MKNLVLIEMPIFSGSCFYLSASAYICSANQGCVLCCLVNPGKMILICIFLNIPIFAFLCICISICVDLISTLHVVFSLANNFVSLLILGGDW